jgi:hypothetical protein
LLDGRRKSRIRSRSQDVSDHWQGNKPAVIPIVPRTPRLSTSRSGIAQAARSFVGAMASDFTGEPLTAGVRAIGKRAGLGVEHPHRLRTGFIMAALDASVPLRDVQIAARHADPRTTTSMTDGGRTSIGMPPMGRSLCRARVNVPDRGLRGRDFDHERQSDRPARRVSHGLAATPGNQISIPSR